jgi:hypothetical protein
MRASFELPPEWFIFYAGDPAEIRSTLREGYGTMNATINAKHIGAAMIQFIVRIVIGLIGAFAIFMAVRFWIDPVGAGAGLGISGQGILGVATLRADFGSIFAVAAILSLAGAIRNDGRFLTAPILLFATALLGRFLTVFLSGLTPSEVQPMVVEAVLVVLLAAGRQSLGVTAKS